MAFLMALIASSLGDAGDREEAGLHDGIDPAAHSRVLGHLVAVYHVELDVLVDYLLLDLLGDPVPHLVLAVLAVEEEYRARLGVLQHVVLLEEDRLVARDEVGRVHEVDRPDRTGPEAQVRDRHRAGLFRVVNEVALGVVLCLLADDLDGILVGADRSVRAEAEKTHLTTSSFSMLKSGSKSRLLPLTSSLMPTTKWFFGSFFANSSKTAFSIAG